MSGSLTLLAKSNDELPVAMSCTSGNWSVMSFSRSPISSIRWASSMITICLLPMIAFRREAEIFSNSCRTSSSSPFRNNTALLSGKRFCNRVVLPTCLGPMRMIALRVPSLALITSVSTLCIILSIDYYVICTLQIYVFCGLYSKNMAFFMEYIPKISEISPATPRIVFSRIQK